MALLDHVGIRVTDLDRAIHFYREMFGFEMVERRKLTGHEEVESAAMKVGEGSLIFLLSSPEFVTFGPSVEGRPDHFCLTFEPDEFEGVMARLRAGGVLERLDCDLRPRTGATGRSPSQYILDPDNNQIEVKMRVAASEGTGASPATAAGTR
jgi:catechol 2,3-dioxygenase-like lactoylglutathione lyase family enzyme